MAIAPIYPDPEHSDSKQGAQTPNPATEVEAALIRSQSYFSNKALSDVNASTAPVSSPDGTRANPIAPPALVQKMASPVTPSGPYSDGGGNRLVTSLPGEARSVGRGGKGDAKRKHMGLDFRANVGEPVLATAAGMISFIGCQRTNSRSRVPMRGPISDSMGNVTGQDNTSVLKNDIGHGGMYVQLIHTAPFAGYSTQYMHLSKVPAPLKQGDTVSAGTVIGYVGQTGGDLGITTGPHLHFQVSIGAGSGGGVGHIILPQQFVPFYVAGRTNLAAGADPVPALLSSSIGTQVPAGTSVAINQSVSHLQGFSRANALENMTPSQVKKSWGTHTQTISAIASVKAAGLMRAVSAFQSPPSQVTSPMSFNFTTGLWSDGLAV